MKPCARCGWKNEDAAVQCGGCFEMLADNEPVEKLTKAGFGIRTLARIIDIVYHMCIVFLVSVSSSIFYIVLERAGMLAPGWGYRLHQFSFGAIALSFVAPLVYYTTCEAIHGATLGKLLCGIRTVREDRTPCHFTGALLRSIAFIWDSFFFGAVAYTRMQKSPLNQRYGDAWGKTAVLKESEIAPENKRGPGVFFIGLALGTFNYAVIMTMVLWIKVS